MGVRVLVLLALAAPAFAGRLGQTSNAAANPIRKVVTMLQAMQTKVTEEGKKQEELYDKFMCYCKTGAADLGTSIAAADQKVPALQSEIKSSVERKAQAETDLKTAQTDREAATAAMNEATALREKEAAAYAADKAELDTNIAALSKATTAIEQGMSGSFLQTGDAQVLRKVASGGINMLDEDRQELVSFLAGSQGSEYAPAGGEITGILKTLNDEMSKSLKEATTTEEAAIKSYDELMAAKKKEKDATIATVEAKTEQIGELGVAIAQMKNELGDTEESLAEDKKFIADLEKSCKTKTAEWEEIKKIRAEELVALADTIKVLNDDDALDLFKKTLPSAASSFVQMQVSSATVRSKAMALLKAAKAPNSGRMMNFLVLALHNKKIGFDKVIKMIDGMVATLKEEQLDDDHKKEYCEQQFDIADDKKKGLERKISDSEKAIATAKEAIETLTEEIAALEKGIKELDKSVAEATEQRQEENEDYKKLMASDTAAKELLAFAKNRLNKFYNPKMYKAPPKRELSEEDRIAVNMGGEAPPTEAPGGIAGTGITAFAQIRAHVQLRKDAPPPPPETFDAYTKKSEENTGVIAMIDLLIKDLDKEMTEAKVEEENAQEDYGEMMKESADKRATDSTLLTEKGVAKSEAEATLQSQKDAKAAAGKELMATLSYISSLHSECDWLMQYYDVRKEARVGEIDSLGKAKAVLSGADFSLLQTKSLRGAQ